MPSDFTREYKEYIESNTPDLWSRIEAGIEAEEKSRTEKTGASESVSADAVTETKSYVKRNEKIIGFGVFAKKAGRIAAAAAIVFVAYALIIVLTKGGMASAPAASESAAPMADSSANYEAAAEAPMAEASEDYADHAAEAEAYDDAAMADEAPAMAEATYADNAAASENAKSAEATDGTAYLAPEAEVKRKLTKDDLRQALGLKDGEESDAIDESNIKTYKGCELTVIEELAHAEQSGSETGYKYGLVFKQGDETIGCLMTEGHAFTLDADSSFRLSEGKTYDIEVIARYGDEDMEYPYVLVAIEQAE